MANSCSQYLLILTTDLASMYSIRAALLAKVVRAPRTVCLTPHGPKRPFSISRCKIVRSSEGSTVVASRCIAALVVARCFLGHQNEEPQTRTAQHETQQPVCRLALLPPWRLWIRLIGPNAKVLSGKVKREKTPPIAPQPCLYR
jgi:hypothetical protein